MCVNALPQKTNTFYAEVYCYFCSSSFHCFLQLFGCSSCCYFLYFVSYSFYVRIYTPIFRYLFTNLFFLFRISFTRFMSIVFIFIGVFGFLFFSLQDMLLRAVRATKIQQTGAQPSIKPHKWSYASAFLYSITLITTIGKYISFFPHFIYSNRRKREKNK